MSSPPQPTHRITGPVELLDAVPYLLGFHPSESLVLVGVQDGLLGVAARLDLADVSQPGLLESTVAMVFRGGADRLVTVVFDDRCAPPAAALGDPGGYHSPYVDWPWSDAVVAVDDAVERVGADLAEAILVCRGRWWSYLCSAAQCCPPEGRALATSPSAFAAAATVEGAVALPNRAALAATLEPLPEPRRAALEQFIGVAERASVAAALDGQAAKQERTVVREVLRTARASTTAGWQPPGDATAARLVAALRVISVRDQVWMAVDARRIDGRRLWTDLARRSPPPYDSPPLFLLAWASWRAGNGTLAGMAAERALLSDSTYSAADLLLAALNQAVDPRTFPCLTEAGFTPGFTGSRRRGRRAAVTRTPR